MARWVAICAILVFCAAVAAYTWSDIATIRARRPASPVAASAPRESTKIAEQPAAPPPPPPPAMPQPAQVAVPPPPAPPAASSQVAAAPPPAISGASTPPPAKPIGEFQPVLHARGAKITTCMDTIVSESAAVIDGQHDAISSWGTAAPNDNLFLSVIGLNYPGSKTAPNAGAIVLAAPVGPRKCEGATVQIYPLAETCSAVQAVLIQEGRTIASLNNLPIVETKTGLRDLLIPSAGGGCVVVGIGVRK